MPRSRLTRTQDAVVCSLILVVVFSVAWTLVRRQQIPPVPPRVQKQGMEKLRHFLAIVENSPWGTMQRGQLLIQKIKALIQKKRVIFTDQIDNTGLTRRLPGRPLKIYIKVLLGANSQYQFQDENVMTEVLFHEALHALKQEKGSLEQECDAYLAGLEARRVFEKQPQTADFFLEDRTVWDFVHGKYPELSAKPDYEPVGRTMRWLRKTAMIP